MVFRHSGGYDGFEFLFPLAILGDAKMVPLNFVMLLS
jgi:hypothetical protein